MPTVGEYMTAAPRSIGSDQPIGAALNLMNQQGIRHLPVLRGGKVVGIVSDRDLQFISALPDVSPQEMPVEEAMNQPVYTVESSRDLAEVAVELVQHKFGSAIVMESTQIVGIFTTTDALRALADALK